MMNFSSNYQTIQIELHQNELLFLTLVSLFSLSLSLYYYYDYFNYDSCFSLGFTCLGLFFFLV